MKRYYVKKKTFARGQDATSLGCFGNSSILGGHSSIADSYHTLTPALTFEGGAGEGRRVVWFGALGIGLDHPMDVTG